MELLANVAPDMFQDVRFLFVAVAAGFLSAFALTVYFWRRTPKPPKGP